MQPRGPAPHKSGRLLKSTGCYPLRCVSWKETLRTLIATVRREQSDPGGGITETLGRSPDAHAGAPVWERRYKRIRDLDEGGMGRVLLAERGSDSVPVCLKFLSAGTDRRTAEQECRALMRLRHPAIVSLLDFSLQDEPPWLATEYIRGSTLQTWLKTNKIPPLDVFVAILKQILNALVYAHSEGVIHRDLKPANMMIESNGSELRVRILDFGIAIVDEFDHLGNLTGSGADPLGTLLYMAPEQLKGEMLTPACDIYAVGLIAWEMLMGRSVFEGKTRSQMMFEKVTRAEGFPIERPPAAVPANLKSAIERCTLCEPAARPAAGELLAALPSL